jgi:hypothetical protein
VGGAHTHHVETEFLPYLAHMVAHFALVWNTLHVCLCLALLLYDSVIMSNVASQRLGYGEECVLTLRTTVHLGTTFVALTSHGSRCVVGVAATATSSKT